MSEKIAVDLGDVQKTLFLPLWGRGSETRKEKPLLVDQTALRILDRVDVDFATIAQRINAVTRAAWIMRSVIVDEAVRAFLTAYPRATIVNIGCGLDTTFDRIDNGQVTWYDLDMPDVIELRKKFIQQTDRRKFIAASFLDQSWLDSIHVEQQVLFVAAGVFYYFTEEQVRAFLIRVADRYPGSELLFDVSSPYGVRVANRAVIRRSGLGEKSYLTWGVESPQVITGWDRRLQLIQVYRYFGARGRKLPLAVRLMGQISDWLKVQYMIQLRIIES